MRGKVARLENALQVADQAATKVAARHAEKVSRTALSATTWCPCSMSGCALSKKKKRSRVPISRGNYIAHPSLTVPPSTAPPCVRACACVCVW
jgi:hypothetical protein